MILGAVLIMPTGHYDVLKSLLMSSFLGLNLNSKLLKATLDSKQRFKVIFMHNRTALIIQDQSSKVIIPCR